MKKLIPMLTLVLLMACQSSSKKKSVDSTAKAEPAQTENADQPSVIGEWTFVSDVESDTSPNIRFISEIKLIGHDGCNQFFGHYEVNAASINFKAISSTKKFCPPAGHIDFASKVDYVDGYKIDGNTLTLSGNGEIMYTLQKVQNATH
ncbi:MAG: META domain-containing protein [Cyclobacteriaceae bacterium]